MIEAALHELGVQVTNIGEREIKGLCPVHHLATGREDRHPAWYINKVTGAWICHSCKQRGSLPYLVELMGGDPDLVGRIPIDYMQHKLASIGEKEVKPEEPFVPPVHVSEYALSKHPYLGRTHRAQKDLTEAAVQLLGIRWHKENRCIILPVYHFDGKLMGWQEKSAGYFNNVPEGLPKRTSLFGFNVLTGGRPAVVESPLDAARFVSYGIPAVAIYGSYPSPEQMSALSNVTDGVVLAFDNDRAGHEASAIAARMLTNLDVRVRFFRYEDEHDNLDPGELPAHALREGYDGATVLAPSSVVQAAEKMRKVRRNRTLKKEEDTMTKLRNWAAQTKREKAT